MNSLDLVKKYGLFIVTTILIGYGLYVLWFLFSTVYHPLFLDAASTTESNRFVIPDPAISNTQSKIQARLENRVDVSTVHNPFMPLPPQPLTAEDVPLLDDFGFGLPE